MAGRVAPTVASAVGRWSGTIRGYLGPRLSRLTGAVGAASKRMGNRITDFARGPAQGELGLQGGGMGGIKGFANRSWQGVKSYGQNMRRAPGATLANTGRAIGRHVYDNRGGYGLSAGMQLAGSMGGPEQPRQPRQPAY